MALVSGAGQAIGDWLLREGRLLAFSALVDGFAWRLRAAGFAVDRLVVSLRVLSANVVAVSVEWRPGQPMKFRTFDYIDRDSGIYKKSPYRVVDDTRRPLVIALDTVPPPDFGIVPELVEDGMRRYGAFPVRFADGVTNYITIASREETALGPDEVALIDEVMPQLAALLEIRTYHRVFHEVLATYVGRGPADKIVTGRIHRGDVVSIGAALLFADLRGFTALSTRLPAEATLDILNRYYDYIVPAVLAEQGEILKFIGDGILAVFDDARDGVAGACARALAAADAAAAAAEGAEYLGEPIHFGIALHHGEAMYGNVGSGDRLDFTVIGRDVNVVSRISTLCGILGRPQLVSESFAAAIGDGRFRTAGSHRVRGLEEPLPVLEKALQAPADQTGVP